MHKFFHKNRTICRPFCLGLVAVTLLGTQIVRANDGQFQNNLLKMDVYKTSQGGVKVNLYTTKPYSDAVVVNKKSDTEYVILMPETASSMTSKPTAKSAPDVLSNIEVKTQQYGSTQGQKGYTKIIISTLKPVEITPQIQTVSTSDYQLSEKETQELISQAGKKQISPAKSAKTQVKTQVKTPTKTAAKAPTKTATKVQLPPTAVPAAIKKVELKKQAQTVAQKPAVTAQNLAQTSAQKFANKPAQTTAKKATEVAVPKKENKKVQTQENLNPQQNPAKPISTATTPVVEPTVPLQTTPTATPTVAPVITPEVAPVAPPKVAPTSVTTGKYEEYKNLIMANKDLWGLALIPIILLLLALRIAKKNKEKQPINKSKSKPPTPMATTSADYSEGITDDMDWKEKFKTYKNKPRPTHEPTPEQTEDSSESILASENWLEEEPSVSAEPQFVEDQDDSEWSVVDVAEENELGQEETPQQNIQEGQIDSIEDSSWLDFDDEEILKDASIDDLFNDEEENFGGNFSEKLGEDFEDSEEATEEIYGGLLHAETLSDAPQEDFDFGGNFEELESEPTPEELFVEKAGEEVTFAGAYQGLLEPQEIVGVTSKEDLQEDLVEKELGLSKKSGFSIDETKGFYLLDFEETTALVGYIGEEVFVLKRFEEPVGGVLKARISEHKGDSANYMVRVADFKALVEVAPENMKLLIEL